MYDVLRLMRGTELLQHCLSDPVRNVIVLAAELHMGAKDLQPGAWWP